MRNAPVAKLPRNKTPRYVRPGGKEEFGKARDRGERCRLAGSTRQARFTSLHLLLDSKPFADRLPEQNQNDQ